MPPRYRRRGRKFQKKSNRKYGRRMASRNRQVHSFKREVFLGTFNTSVTGLGVTTQVAQGFSFALSNLPNVTEYTALYDLYKFNGIKFKIMPKSSNIGNAANSNTVPGFGQIITALDWTDAANPTSRDQLLQYSTAKVSHPGRQHTRYFKPKMLNAVYRTGLTFAYNSIGCKWINMSNDDVPVYGVKVWIDPPTLNGLVGSYSPLEIPYDIYATYYFQCKTTR